MNNESIIKNLNNKLKDIQYLTDNLNNQEYLSQIDIDLILSKVRIFYDDLLKIKISNEVTIVENKIIAEILTEKVKNEEPESIKIEDNPVAEKVQPEQEKKDKIIEKVIEQPELNEEPVIEKELFEEKQKAPAPPKKKIIPITPKIVEKQKEITNEVIEEKEIIIKKEPVIIEEIKEEVVVETEIKTEVKSTVEPEQLLEIDDKLADGSTRKPEIKQISLFGENIKQEEIKKDIQPKQIEKKESISDKLHSNQLSVNDVLSNQVKDKNIASQLQHKPITNIKSAISLNDMIWFVKELFNNNNNKYNEVIDKINSFNNYNEALDYLSGVFNLNEEKESLNKFLEIVQRRFLTK